MTTNIPKSLAHSFGCAVFLAWKPSDNPRCINYGWSVSAATIPGCKHQTVPSQRYVCCVHKQHFGRLGPFIWGPFILSCCIYIGIVPPYCVPLLTEYADMLFRGCYKDFVSPDKWVNWIYCWDRYLFLTLILSYIFQIRLWCVDP